jgi:hypothetical protein
MFDNMTPGDYDEFAMCLADEMEANGIELTHQVVLPFHNHDMSLSDLRRLEQSGVSCN